ncbi:MAG TPA: hypothetical protein HA254_01545 [Candidatus Diapherotrites archaeon]|uniref:DOD-type homing endonuclease domain-containing protein n=1 Tax=Candidatus Iainarchaeum sp. TaxID=3101447 RepID=A0A7J4IV60_9ARCH|nr:hypothetical protein [Candidatus Diapherotrites archaeon]
MEITYSPELAEICGIHAGDGYLRDDGHRHELDISGAIEEYEYYDTHIVSLFEKVFEVKPEPRYFPARRTYGFVIRNRKIINFMHSLGFPFGKKTCIVGVPSFISEAADPKIASSFIRGVFDTDGALSFQHKDIYKTKQKTKHYYPQIKIGVCSKPLADGTAELLERAGFHYKYDYTRPIDERRHPRYILTLRGNNVLDNWLQKIGIKNSSKYSRYKVWKQYGFCPPYTSYLQRRLILNNC